MKIKFCSACGGEIVQRIPEDDTHLRSVCTRCHLVHYENPKMVVGTIPAKGSRILLCRRNIEPRKGLWTLPAGYLENGESVQDGAVRETREESLAQVRIIAPYRLFNIAAVHQMYLMFRARMTGDTFGPTPESTHVRLFALDEIPWDEIAFDVIHRTLSDYVEDHDRHRYPFAIRDIILKTRQF